LTISLEPPEIKQFHEDLKKHPYRVHRHSHFEKLVCCTAVLKKKTNTHCRCKTHYFSLFKTNKI